MTKALIFDVFGTVVDWRTGVAREVESFFAQHSKTIDATTFADAWRAKYQPSMAEIRKQGRSYVALDVLHRENLESTLMDFDLDGAFDDDALYVLTRAWEKLPPWPDSVSGLTKLKSQYAIATCSNGSISLMTWLAKFGGLPWDAILGAQIAENYKPHPSVYLKSVASLGLEPKEVMMVAAHNGDLAAARETGLKTAFIHRPNEHGPNQTTDLKAESDWDYIAFDMNDLARQLVK